MSSCSSSDGPPRPTVVKKFENIFFIIDISFCMSVRILIISSSGSSEDEESTPLYVRLEGGCSDELEGGVVELVDGEGRTPLTSNRGHRKKFHFYMKIYLRKCLNFIG